MQALICVSGVLCNVMCTDTDWAGYDPVSPGTPGNAFAIDVKGTDLPAPDCDVHETVCISEEGLATAHRDIEDAREREDIRAVLSVDGARIDAIGCIDLIAGPHGFGPRIVRVKGERPGDVVRERDLQGVIPSVNYVRLTLGNVREGRKWARECATADRAVAEVGAGE